MPSRWPRSISIFEFLALVALVLLGACGQENGPEPASGAVATDPRAMAILDESGDLASRLDLIESLSAPCPQDVVEALLVVMKDRSQQAYITVVEDTDLGYRVEESPFGGPDERAELRWTAIMALERLGEVQALPDLLAALEDRDPVVRNHAARALWHLGSTRGLPVLVKALEGKAFENETANRILKEISGQDFGFGTDIGWKLKSEAIARWKAWLAGNPRPPRELPKMGQDADLDRRVRFLVAILGQHQFLFMEQARRELSHLGGLGIDHIRAAFADPTMASNQQLRAYAVQALAGMEDPAALALIVERLEKDPDPPIRSRAAEAIGLARDGGRDALVKALDDPDSSVVIAAVRALGRRGIEGVEEPIRSLFTAEKSSDRLRLTAAFALVRHDRRSDGAGDYLLKILEEGGVGEKAELAELLQEWQGSLLGWDERKATAEQPEALAGWRRLLRP